MKSHGREPCDDNELNQMVDDRVDLPISRQLMTSGFSRESILKSWKNQLMTHRKQMIHQYSCPCSVPRR